MARAGGGDAERTDVPQPDSESLETTARVRFGLGHHDGRFTPDAEDPYGIDVEIKAHDLNSKSSTIQFAHNNYPDKYQKFLKQHLLVILHRGDVVEEYWLLKKGGNGYWKNWVLHRQDQHRFEHGIAQQMVAAWREIHGEPTESQRKRLTAVVRKAQTGKQWTMAVSKVRKYGQRLTDRWPARSYMYSRKPISSEDTEKFADVIREKWS